jgi:hypothetical protein
MDSGRPPPSPKPYGSPSSAAKPFPYPLPPLDPHPPNSPQPIHPTAPHTRSGSAANNSPWGLHPGAKPGAVGLGPWAWRAARWASRRRPMPVSNAVLRHRFGVPAWRAASRGRGSPSLAGRRTCQPLQRWARAGSAIRDSSSATGTRAANRSKPSGSATASGCSSQSRRGSPARRSAQDWAVGRSRSLRDAYGLVSSMHLLESPSIEIISFLQRQDIRCYPTYRQQFL